jgi:hypothetical protein
MDSWSRPSKGQAAPPPFYLTQGESARYCHTCGRIIGSRRTSSSKASSSEVKYCSDKCKHNKSKDKSIEIALLALLLGKDPQDPERSGATQPTSLKAKPKTKKGDPRIIVKMSDIETAVFGNMNDPEKVYGRNKNRVKRGLPDQEEWRSVDMECEAQQVRSELVVTSDGVSDGNSALMQNDMIAIQHHIRPTQLNSDVNGSIGGEKGWAERIEETPDMLQKRLEGQKKAQNRELVRNAARRAVAFGLLFEDTIEQPKHKHKGGERPEEVRRKCEALMNGTVVDPSFAKGDWSIRWRED